MKSNTSIIYAVALFGTFLLGYILWNIDYDEQGYSPCAMPIPPVPICGTVSPYNENLSENGKKGEIIFKTNCAACHKVQRQMTGPGLLSVISNYDSDSLFFDYIRKPKPDIGKRCFQFEKTTLEDASCLREYILAFE